MKNSIAAFLAIVLVSTISDPLLAQFRNRRDGIPDAAQYGWLSSLEQGKAQAQKTGKPLMVVVRCVP